MGKPLMILVAGPYRSGTNDEPSLIAANVDAMTEMAWEIYKKGHLPVLGEWFALPIIEKAGSTQDWGFGFQPDLSSHSYPAVTPLRCSVTYRRNFVRGR